MNKERLAQLADKIASLPHAKGWFAPGYAGSDDIPPPGESFNMSTWRHDHQCGTVACIAGFALLMWPHEVNPKESTEINATRILGLTPEDAHYLFRGYWVNLSIDEISPTLAAAELRDMVAQS